MPRQIAIALENNFSKGLITEASTLNFPANAFVEGYNCVLKNTGGVRRRLGIDRETNYSSNTIDRSLKAISHFVWSNVGADGATKLFVKQVGTTLYFYSISASTEAAPLSSQKLVVEINLSTYTATGGTFNAGFECQFAEGNGYLFVWHPSMDPIYCTYSNGYISATAITIKIRDFQGYVETGVDDTSRLSTLSAIHSYNLGNQGWGKVWSDFSSSTITNGTGSKTFTISITTLPIVIGDRVRIWNGADPASASNRMIGNVTAYSGTSLTVNVTTAVGSSSLSSWSIRPEPALIDTWAAAVGNYPSNADSWWLFKDTDHLYNPTDMINEISIGQGPAPKGFFILDAFRQLRSSASGIQGISDTTTTVRPRAGTWFQGRVWSAGVDASGFTENIYFSQIVERPDQFGKAYQINDPSAEERSDLLPSDGGLINIQGCGSVYKLSPIQNGLVVNAANGVWFITGSQGIGFTAADYTITKLSSIQSISASSFVDVQGLPMWWNAEGIYGIQNGQNGLEVKTLTFASIQDFYDGIPLLSKAYARGYFDPLDYTVRWVYRTTNESTVTDRYEFDGVLTFNTGLQAFSPWTLSSTSGVPFIHGVFFMQGPGGSTVPEPVTKYIVSVSSGGSYSFSFAEELDPDYYDWQSTGTDYDYSAYIITGYRTAGDAIRRYQDNWIRIFADNADPCTFKVQNRWDAAISGASGKWSSSQIVVMEDANLFSKRHKRLKLRGSGFLNQLKFTSVPGEPMDLEGWSTYISGNSTI